MTPVWLIVRAGLRARWRTWLVLAVLTGLAGGLVTAVPGSPPRGSATASASPHWRCGPQRQSPAWPWS